MAKKKTQGWLDKYQDGGEFLGTTNKGFDYNGAWNGPSMQMGGSLPGAVGFTYARTQGAAPSNGPYAKKTMASAQNGMEMKFYQEGLDWTPRNISEYGSEIPNAQKGKKIDIGTLMRANQVINQADNTGVKTPESLRKIQPRKEMTKQQVHALNLEGQRKQSRIADRKAAVNTKDKGTPYTLPSGETKKYSDMDWREKAYVDGKALEQRGRINPNDESFFDEWINPVHQLTNIASGLGKAPYEARESDSIRPYIGAIGTPLVAGALGFDPLGSATKVPSKIAQSMLIGYKPVKVPTQITSSSVENIGNTVSKNLEDLKAIQEFAQKYRYELPQNLERIAQSNELTDRTVRGIMNRHNTFVRGVSTNWDELQKTLVKKHGPEKGKELWKDITDNFEKNGIDYINNPQGAAKYMSTHIPISTGYGRASLNKDVFNQGLEGLYTSNSIPTAEGYTYGQGFITKVKKPTDFSSANRQDWITKNNPEYNIGVLPSSRKFSSQDLSHINNEKLNSFLEQGRINDTEYELINEYLKKSSDIKKQLHAKYDIDENTDIFSKKYDDFYEEYQKQKDLLAKHAFDIDLDKSILKTEHNKKTGFAHYIHLGKPGEKILEPIKSWEIIPETWKNKSRAHSNAYTKKLSALEEGGNVIKDDRGQWAHPGEITEIGSNDITMEGVPYPVLGISDEGDTKLMKPGKNYKFKGKKVTEYPVMQNGGTAQHGMLVKDMEARLYSRYGASWKSKAPKEELAEYNRAVYNQNKYREELSSSVSDDTGVKKALPKQVRPKEKELSSFQKFQLDNASKHANKFSNMSPIDKGLYVGDVLTDVMQAGNFVPHPIGQAIGNAGNILGSAIDAYQAVRDLYNGDYTGAIMNGVGLALPMALGRKGYTRDMWNTEPGSLADKIASLGNREGDYIHLTAPSRLKDNPVIKKGVNYNRGLLGTLGAETVYDSYGNTSYQNGGRVPIYTEDSNDPRLKAYQDSLYLSKAPMEAYKRSQTIDKLIEKGDFDKANNLLHRGYIFSADARKVLDRLTKYNKKEPKPIKGTSMGWGLSPIDDVGPTYKKPVQPVVYKKPEPKKEVKKPEPVKKEQPKPIETKQNTYEGSPVYSPGAGSGAASSLVGFSDKAGNITYIKPEDYKRFGVTKSTGEYINSKSSTNKKKNGGWLDKYEN